MNWEEVKTTFKEVFGDHDSYLLKRLNDGEDISSDSGFDAKRVGKKFISSRICFLHNTAYKKTCVQAFHIPDEKGRVHHYDIHFVRFQRKKISDEWQKIEIKNLKGKEEVENLINFLDEQNKIVGKESKHKYWRLIGSDEPIGLNDLSIAINLALKNKEVDFSKLTKGEATSISDLVSKIVDKGNVVIEKKLYQNLISARTNPKFISYYEKDLVDFKKLIAGLSTTETDMQNFLKEKVWFFGLNYFQTHQRCKSKFSTTIGSEYDFLLEGFNQVYDIAELKGPNDSMFDKYSSGVRKNAFDSRIDYKFSDKFSRALHQVISYIDEFEQQFKHIQEHQPSIREFFYPKGVIVISRRDLFPKNGKDSQKYLHLTNRQFANIDILTYDDLADRAEIIINFMREVRK
jgi:hypothetical protein